MNFSDKQVLIVEDQRPFLLLLRGLLQSMGASDVVTKSSAEKALSLCKKQKFDIVVCDLHLGVDRKNGFELIEELRIKRLIKPTTVFLLISADSARPVVLGSIERRPDDYLIKPFSQVQLKTRITRAWQKRQFLGEVLQEVANENINRAIDLCEDLISTPSPYKGTCEQLLVELYLRLEQFDKALDVLKPYIDGKPVLWARVALAKTYLSLKKFDKAIDIAEDTIKRNRFNAEAHDVLAKAFDAKQQGETAIAAIKEAIKLSPYSLPRHFSACSIGRNHNDFILASTSSMAIWDLSKRTVNQNSLHWCGVIRSLLDVAEYTDDKRTRNRYQQEALLALQRGMFDENIQRIDDEFDVSIFGSIVNARVNAIDGKMLDAKKNLAHSQAAIEQKYDATPVVYIPDSIKVMYDLGEFEDALQLQEIVKAQKLELDSNSEFLLRSESTKAKQNFTNYQQFNREGIQLYQQGQYEKAKESFALAQGFSPVNTGVALNLLQCLLQILSKNQKADPELFRECRRLYKLIDDMPLKIQHQDKYTSLREDLDTFMGSK
ncbi:response regulator [Alteromonas sp. 1_MG-2023]|uniref:tetratricopeptide repeat-containing response regulator n=1 Tax=Alteromonas sp. 1_MG-2023 TaxID=3062669 RepID=UPI0026E482B0|nr:tetratricopeptide repeat-containing response regulator [Alteromonas sp. 1_MG-2023]MDO6565932.1 response regulator [Alteromonas sp. 1_MG-2023]